MSGHPIITKETSIKQYHSIVKHFGITVADQESLNRKMKNSNSVFSIKCINGRQFENVGIALQNYYPKWPIDLIEVVSKCLQFKPSKRKTTKLLLNEAYFVNVNF